MNKKQFLLCKKLFGHINHHQLLNEYVLHDFFAFYHTLLIVKNNWKQYNTLRRRKNALPSWEFALCCQLVYVTSFLNKTSLSKSFCSLRVDFQRAIYDTSRFFKKFLKFTSNSFSTVITWKTKNMQSLFPFKD